MRKINTNDIKETVYELCVQANTVINPEIIKRLEKLVEDEKSPIAKDNLEMMLSNFTIAQEKNLPICQDTGMVVIFLDLGQDVKLEGEYLETTIQQAVKDAYKDHYFRKSIVSDPIERINTGTNTPAIIHTRIVPGDKVSITLTAKGFGSENTSQLKMLKPSDGLEGVEAFIKQVVKDAIPNGCAPLVVGIGIGGDFEQCAINAKRALTLPFSYSNPSQIYSELEERILNYANNTGIGPMGTGGKSSVMKVNIIESPTHIAGLPVAVNICCYVDRVVKSEL